MTIRFSHRVEYGALRVVCGVVRLLPYRAALALGWALARLSFQLMSERKRKVAGRLRQVFGDKYDEPELRRLLWLAWRNLCFNAIEMVRTVAVTREWVEKVVDRESRETVLARIRPGRGIVIAVPHLGNWELAGVSLALLGVPLMTIARNQKNPLTNELINRMREYTGMEAIAPGSKGLATVVPKLRQGKVLAILPDLRAKTSPVTVRFLGAEADIPRGMAAFAREAGVPIMPAYALRRGWARHSWILGPEISPDPSLDAEKDEQRMTQAVMDVLDRAVREHPDQYFWFNKRWILNKD